MILTSLKVVFDSKGWIYEEDFSITMPNLDMPGKCWADPHQWVADNHWETLKRGDGHTYPGWKDAWCLTFSQKTGGGRSGCGDLTFCMMLPLITLPCVMGCRTIIWESLVWVVYSRPKFKLESPISQIVLGYKKQMLLLTFLLVYVCGSRYAQSILVISDTRGELGRRDT